MKFREYLDNQIQKGKIEWDAELFAKWARDLENTSKFGVERGFLPGMEGGKTRARPEIWLNSDDFNAKLMDFREATARLASPHGLNYRLSSAPLVPDNCENMQ